MNFKNSKYKTFECEKILSTLQKINCANTLFIKTLNNFSIMLQIYAKTKLNNDINMECMI